MPQVVIAAAMYAAKVIAFKTLIAVVAVSAFNAYQQKKARAKSRAAYNASLEDRLVMTSTTDGDRSVIYGTARNVDGIVYKATSGEKSEFYTFVVALAGHEVESIEKVYFDDQEVSLNGDNYVTTEPFMQNKKKAKVENKSGVVFSGGQATVVLDNTPVVGSISASLSGSGDTGSTLFNIVSVAGKNVTISGAIPDGTLADTVIMNYQYTDAKSKARVWKYTGAPGQNIGALLQSLGVGQTPVDPVGTNHKFSGMAALVVQLEYDQEAYVNGVPTFSALVKGKKIYDPRTDTVAWEHNPALIARDWATYRFGCAIPEDQIDDEMIILSANYCDILHTFETPLTSNERRMYSCGIVLKSGGSPMEGLNAIVESMAGKWVFSGGKLKVKAGMYTAPVADLDESWLSNTSSIDVNPGVSQQDLINIYRPSIADEAQNYIYAPAPEIRAEPYIADDGRELPMEVDLEGVTNTDHAQHVCSVLMRDLRQGLTVQLPCNLKAYPIEPLDVITLSLERYGFVEKEFEVLSKSFSQTQGVILYLKETTAIIFDPDAGFSDLDIAPNTKLPTPWIVSDITGFNVVSGGALLEDGSLVSRTVATWDQVADMAVLQSGKIEVQYKLAEEVLPEEGWNSWVEEGSAIQAVFIGLEINKVYIFRARAINSLGIRGDWTPQVSILIQPPALPGAMDMELLTSTTVFIVDSAAVISPEKATLRLIRGDGLTEPAVWTVEDGTAVIQDTLDPDVKEVPGLNLTTQTATIRATITQGSETVYREVTIARITDGSTAKSLIIGATAFGFVFNNGVNDGPPITFTSYEQNLEGTVSWTATAFDADGVSLGAVPLTGSGITRQLSVANFLTYPDTSYVQVEIESTVDGLSDLVSVYRVDSGSSTVTLFLTNEAHVVPSDALGNVTSYAGASTDVLVWRGAEDETSTWTITHSASAGLTTSQTGTSIVTVAVTSMTTGVNSGYVDITATKGSETVTKRFSISKSKQGEDGEPGENAVGIYLSATSQVFQINKAGATNPANITLTGVRQNTSSSISWSVISGTATLDDPTAISRRLTFSNMVSDVVTIQASVTEGGVTYSDRITIVKVREGADAYTVFLTNESHNLSGSSSGVVSDYSGCGGTMKVYKGALDVTSSCSFSVQSNSYGLTTSIGASSGIYQVTGGMNSLNIATVEFKAIHDGNAFVKRFTVSKANAGSPGPSGQRGSVDISAYYSSLLKNTSRGSGFAWWSSSNTQPTQGDVAANSAITSATGSSTKVIGDTVTLYNTPSPANATIVVTGVWDGANWLNPGTIIDGNLLVKGTVVMDRLAAGQASFGGGAFEVGINNPNSGNWGTNVQDGLFLKRSSAPTSGSVALRVNDTSTLNTPASYIQGYSECMEVLPRVGVSGRYSVIIGTNGNSGGLSVYASGVRSDADHLVKIQDGAVLNNSFAALGVTAGRRVAKFSASNGASGGYTVLIEGTNDFGISTQAGYLTAAAYFLNNYGSAGGAGAIVRRTRGATTRNINLATETYSAFSATGEGKIYIQDGNGPFTGFHEGVIDDTDAAYAEVGDIMVDEELVERTSVNDTMFRHALSSAPNQKGVIGVCAQIYSSPPEGFAYSGDMSGKSVIHLNALGEGQVNVCGENGDIQKGDLIVTSSTHGKGMKQSDDIIRSYTVARARESVIFDTPEEVKMVACVYLCG